MLHGDSRVLRGNTRHIGGTRRQARDSQPRAAASRFKAINRPVVQRLEVVAGQVAADLNEGSRPDAPLLMREVVDDESGHGALIAGGCGTAFGDRVLAEIDLGKNLPRGLSRRVDSDRPPRRCPGFDPPLAIGYFWLLLFNGRCFVYEIFSREWLK